jgi:hypothetical protein
MTPPTPSHEIEMNAESFPFATSAEYNLKRVNAPTRSGNLFLVATIKPLDAHIPLIGNLENLEKNSSLSSAAPPFGFPFTIKSGGKV